MLFCSGMTVGEDNIVMDFHKMEERPLNIFFAEKMMNVSGDRCADLSLNIIIYVIYSYTIHV